jgi:hypothetical protein
MDEHVEGLDVIDVVAVVAVGRCGHRRGTREDDDARG